MGGMKWVFRKELARIFKDKKMVMAVFVIPVVLMVGIMWTVGIFASKMEADIESHKDIVYIMDAPESFTSFLKAENAHAKATFITGDAKKEETKLKIKDGNVDLLVQFPEDFDAQIENYKNGDLPQVMTFHNPSMDYSRVAYQEYSTSILETFRLSLLTERIGDLNEVKVFALDADNPDQFVQDEASASGQALGSMLPYFVTILLFAGAMGIGTDMIAGEKERGTMASLLVTPVSRTSIVLGKVFALMTISGLAAIINVVVMVFAMPALMHGESNGFDVSFSWEQILMLAAILIATAFLYSSIIVLVSVFAKSVKEASSNVMPVYILVLVVGLSTMFGSNTPPFSSYFVPIYNVALTLKGILSYTVYLEDFLATLSVTLVLGGVITVIVSKAFNSEKIMAP